ncbi:hypothetical protein SAMN05421594_1319 [Chryseobacterium oleae]|uniref:Immunity protein 50 n=1 Tax=Chryseobacterium oleae TaxID=491207 RepID=A0A1I4WKE1_CHROL|nr:hypothetical protein [Chryseobacterium oleae]SFN14158.1 hypothetical protein SAMN05421594_1319 [Chryseobacterium oleae]
MKKIKNLEKITSIYRDWKPSDIAFIKSLEWSTQNLVINFYCQLRENVNGWPDVSGDFFEVSILFKTVSSLNIKFSGMGLHQISGFDILDLSANGLENINFQIEDYEDDSINFFCKEIEINNVSASKKK